MLKKRAFVKHLSMNIFNEQATASRATGKILGQDRLIETVFPFVRPPQEVIDNAFFIVDPELQLQRGFHQTNSTVLLHPRSDGNVLVPGIVLGADQPLLHLRFAAFKGMERTQGAASQWGVWVGKTPIARSASTRHISYSYTPERATRFLELTRSIKRSYQQRGQGQGLDRQKIAENLSLLGLAGGWFRQYSQDLPDALEHGDRAAIKEIERLFLGFEDELAAMDRAYQALGLRERLLLEHGFNLSFELTTQHSPFYLSAHTKQELATLQSMAVRDPREIAVEPRGIKPDLISAVWLPDGIAGTAVERVAFEQLLAMGIEQDKIRHTPEFTGQAYANCLLRYDAFTGENLAAAISEGKLVPIRDANQQQGHRHVSDSTCHF